MQTTTAMTVYGYKIQRDESGVGHCWRDVPADSTEGGCADEVQGWASEERPESGTEYRAANGMTYRVVSL